MNEDKKNGKFWWESFWVKEKKMGECPEPGESTES